jgi:hypothetical protein
MTNEAVWTRRRARRRTADEGVVLHAHSTQTYDDASTAAVTQPLGLQVLFGSLR